MSFVITVAMATAAVTVQPVSKPMVKRVCQQAGSPIAERAREPLRWKRLGQEPPANLYLSVYRTEGGCMKPMIVRHNIGGR